MKLGEYLLDKTPQIVISIIGYVITIFLLNAFKVRNDLKIAVTIIFIVVLLLNIFIEYLQKHRFYTNLLNTLETLDKKYLILEMINKPNFYEGEIFYQTLYEINKSMIENVKEYNLSITDFKEYVEMWIHEVKIPISSLTLLNHNHQNQLDKRYIDRACITYRMKRIPNVVGKTFRNDACESAGFKYVPWVILASSVVSVAAGLIHGRNALFSTLVLTLGICAGFTGEVSFVLPYNSAQKRLKELGCMIFGAFSIDRLKDVRTLIVKDKDLFPDDCAAISDIKFIKAEYMSETVEYLALILRKIKSPLYASMERYIFRADESLHSVENFKAVQEHGFAATIDGREVLYGTRNLLLSYGIKPLTQEKEAEQTSRGFSTAYTVIDGTVSAVVFAEYKANPKLKKAVERVGRDITVIVQTEDPLVTEATVQKRYSLTNATMTVATAEETIKLNAVRKRLTRGKKTRPVMLSTKSALGTLSGIEMAQQLSSALTASVRIKQISVFTGLALTAIAALAVPALLSPVWVLVFNIIWTLPVIGLSFGFILK